MKTNRIAMTILLLLLAFRSVVCAQSPSVLLFGRRASYTDPSGSNTLYAWWVASDLTLNWKVGNTNPWTDRINGVLLRQADAASAYPSNTTLGLDFVGTSWLTNAPLAAGTNSTVAIILRPRSLNTVNGMMSIWNIGSTFNGQLGVNDTGKKFTWWNLGAHDFGSAVIVSNSYTVMLIQSNATLHAYTNGVFAATIADVPLIATGWAWQRVGDDSTSDGRFDGWIREMLVWSNVLTSAQAALVHKYATNTYSP